MSEARKFENDRKTTSVVKVADRGTLRDVELGDRCVCDCNTCDIVHRVRDAAQVFCGVHYGTCTSSGACRSPTTSTARRLANLQYRNVRLGQSLHCACTSRHRKKHKRYFKINLKVKNIAKQITTKYLQKIKRFISTKTKSRKSWFKTNRKINQLASLTGNDPRRRKKYHVVKTAPRLGIPLATSVNVLKTSTVFISVSSSSATTITSYSRKCPEAHGNNPTKITAPNLFSKLMLSLKPFFGVIMKLQTTKKFNRKKHTACERPTVVLSYIIPYENTLDGINKIECGTQSSVINVISDMSSAPDSSMESFNDQEIQVSVHSTVHNLIADVETFVKKPYTYNAYSQCILRPNDVLLQYRNKNTKNNIKKSPRVTFRGHHKRFMTKTYGQNFNKMYHTFLAEVNYTDQPLQNCQNDQGVASGSTWDIDIDCGKSQNFPVQLGADHGSCTIKKQPPDGALGPCLSKSSDSQLCQCPPVYGACDRNVCYKRARKTAPYGSHASTQSFKSKKIQNQRAAREITYGRKKANTARCRNIKRRRERRLAGNQIASAPTGLPCRQPLRIESQSKFNIQLYKQTPLGARTTVPLNKRPTCGQIKQRDTTARRKAGKTMEKKRPLKMLPCDPGIRVLDKCDPYDCYRRQKCSVTETSRGYSSQVSSQTCGRKGRQVRTKRETLCKEKGTSSKPGCKAQLNMPNRQAVRIGSKFSFNVEYYKSMPNSGLLMSNQDSCATAVPWKVDRTREKKRPLKMLPCEPAIRVRDKYDPYNCYRRQKISVTETSSSCSSQASTQTRGPKGGQLRTRREKMCTEKGTSSKPRPKAQLNMPNRQAVRIGSKCSFNIEFYKSMPKNALSMSTQDLCDTNAPRKACRPRKQKRSLEMMPCEPGISAPDKCPSDCYRRQKISVTETSSSCSSQASTQTRGLKGGQLRTGREKTCKEQGTSSKPRPKAQLNMPNRQAVRIGSKCNFNIEFYKSMPKNALSMSTQDLCDTTVPRKACRPRKKKRPLEMMPCEPRISVSDKCPSDCYRTQKVSVTETSSSCSSQASTQTRGLKGGQLRTGREKTCKEQGTSSKPRPKAQLNMPNRQAVRIGSKCNFNIEFYKSMPKNALSMSMQDLCDTTVPRKACRTRKKKRSLEMVPCEPGISVPDKCPSDYYRRQKNSVTEKSSSCSSQASTPTRGLKGGQRRTGREKICKEQGTSSKPRPKAQLNMPNRQAVRIGSKCSFNIEFYKSMPKNALSMSMQDLCDTTVPRKACRPRKKKRPLEMMPCEPRISVSDKCPSDCYRTQKVSVTETSSSCSSQASTQTRGLKGGQLRTRREKICKEKGTSSKPRPKAQLNMPNRQAVRIGSKCSFNIEFYKSMPKNALAMSTQDLCDTTVPRKARTRKKKRPLELMPCEPRISVPDKCPSACYRQQKVSVTETSSSCSSQASTQTRGIKGGQLRTGREKISKEKGTSSKPRPKAQLNMPNRQAVRIGSKCSFNIEFYKSLPQNALAMNERNRSDTSEGCKDIVKKNKEIKEYQCEPRMCNLDKCDAKGFQKIKIKQSTSSLTCSSKGTSQGSQTSTKSGKKRQEVRAKSTCYKDKGLPCMPRAKGQLSMPNRQAVRIGSTCSFNIEFYKSMPQSAFVKSESDRCYTSDGRKSIGKITKEIKEYQCEPKVCTLSKCDAKECFQKIKIKPSTGSLTCSSKGTSQGSQTSTKSGKKRQEVRAKSTSIYKNKSLPCMPRAKGQLNMPNRQAVRIGSTCSFNVEFYKSMPQSAFAKSESDRGYTSDGRKSIRKKPKEIKEYQCEPRVCTIGKCDAKECFQKIKIKQSTGSLTCSSKGSQTSTKSGKKRQQVRAKSTPIYKNKGLPCMPRAKGQLNMPNRQVVRIGSTCSFNVEFYKSLPQSAFAKCECDRGYKSEGRKSIEKKNKEIKEYQCKPRVCTPGKCNANECFQVIKSKQSTDGSRTSSSKGTSQGSQTSTRVGKKRKELKAKSAFCKDKGSSSTRPKKQSKMSKRQPVCIRSKCSFNIEFYKSVPQSAKAMSERNRGNNSDGRVGKKDKVIKYYQCEPGMCEPGKCNAKKCFHQIKCEPGVCTPGKCDAKECFIQIKTNQSNSTNTSFTGSSKGTSQGSQTSKKSGKKRQELRVKSTFYKDKGLSSMPRAKGQLYMPNREAVRIGSTCSFNIELYKSLPQSALAMSESDRGDTAGKKSKVLKQYQCEPGVCTPGKCNANECFQVIKTKQSSITAGKKGKVLKQYQCEPGVCTPGKCNANECFQVIKTKQSSITAGKKGKALKQNQCEPGVCTPGKCNANECFQVIKTKQSADGSRTRSSKGTSQGSQTSTKTGKKGQELRAKSNFYKDKGSSSMRPKKPSKVPKREAVRIGSKCSFNIEIYKSVPQSAIAMSEQNRGHTSDGRKGSGKKDKVIKNYQCEPGVCEPGKCNAKKCFQVIKTKQSSITAGKKGKVLKQYQCEPGVCTPDKCNANECFQQIKTKQSTATDGSLTGNSKGTTSQGSQISTKARNKRQELKSKSTFYKDKGSSSMPRPKAYLNMPNRQAVRIGSTCSFNVEFYKSCPEQAGTGKKGQALKKYQCEPGVCVPSKCNPSECFQVLKTNYEASGFGSSLTGSSRGSQANSYRSNNKTQLLKSGNATFYKDKGVASKQKARKLLHKQIKNKEINPRPFRIASDCSLNIEFYKCWSQTGQAMRPISEQAGTRKKRSALGKYQCKPGVCVSGECSAKQCFQRLTTENETSGFASSLTGSLGSWVAKMCKKKTQMLKSSADIKPNRQAVRIGSMCSFNIDFHAGRPQEILVPNQQSSSNVSKTRQKRNRKEQEPRKRKPGRIFECKPNVCIPGQCNPVECLKHFECKPRVCVPGKCDPSDCIQRLSGTEESPRKRKPRRIFECKPNVCIPGQCNPVDCLKHFECIPRVCVPGKCDPSDCIQRLSGTEKSPRKRKPRRIFECKPNVCIPGQCNPVECLKHFECKPRVCVPGKCDPSDCIQRLSGTEDSFTGSSLSTQSRKLKGGMPRVCDKTFYKEKGVSCIPGKPSLRSGNHQGVRIGSSCSFNIEFYKEMSHPDQNNQGDNSKKRGTLKKYECMPGICKPGKCNAVECYNRLKNNQSSSAGKISRKTRKALGKYECEPGVCVPGKCNAKECFQIFKRKHKIDTDGSFTDSSVTASRASQVSKKRKSKPPQLTAGKASFYTERGASTIPRSKMLLHLQNHQAVRIGSTCSFNIEFYKALPGQKRPRDANFRQIQPPFQYNIEQSHYYPSSSKTSRDSISTSKEKIGDKKGKISAGKENVPGKKENVPGKKEKVPGKKDKVPEPKEKDKSAKQRKRPTGQQEQGDTTVQKKSSSDTRVKKREPKRKTTEEKPSSRQTEQGDATSKQKETTVMGKPKEIRYKRKQSQTRVRDQLNDTQVNEKVGTGKLRSQGDTPGQHKETKKIGKYDEGDKGVGKETVSTNTVVSPTSSDSVLVSKKTSVNLDRKKEAARRKTETSKLPVHKDMGISHIAADKKGEGIQQRIPPLATPGTKKQVCRIGSSCSFNFQLYKDKPLSPDQVASLRSASTPSTPDVQTGKNNMANYIRKCMCKFTGPRGTPFQNVINGVGSQTKQKSEYVPGPCDYAKCEKNQCPARFNIETGIGTDTCGRGKPPVSCCTNAATQSRRCPVLQQLAMRGPNAATRLRNVPYPSIVPGNWPFGPVPGYGDNFNRCIVREQAVILGSGCGWNVNFFKKRNKRKK